ncbi:hypothetical protein EDI_339330 [Entamoeba dispar SAW760]|uniref:Uncharacterized protein n=1 Tax=Entamoeba dispar (strain ATCC PRA-260 / SAW760) TaxID=370354 RepID=B0EDV0_ENTDS|nr:uncharacterized protein EDI_339330 [Entamoeba dispar SAW760]EDR27289.1 hypothetical protein EDI_339330 [Entamoeba dispar SAW760]|eukprot:EDR27289.1 hypothetical protein EDI_339330 [Entamoeba dispar SAW760]
MNIQTSIKISINDYVNLLLLKDKTLFQESIIQQLTQENKNLKTDLDELTKKYEETCLKYASKIEEDQSSYQVQLTKLKKELEEKQNIIENERTEKLQIKYESSMMKLKVSQYEKEIEQLKQEIILQPERKIPTEMPTQIQMENLEGGTDSESQTELNIITESKIKRSTRKRKKTVTQTEKNLVLKATQSQDDKQKEDGISSDLINTSIVQSPNKEKVNLIKNSDINCKANQLVFSNTDLSKAPKEIVFKVKYKLVLQIVQQFYKEGKSIEICKRRKCIRASIVFGEYQKICKLQLVNERSDEKKIWNLNRSLLRQFNSCILHIEDERLKLGYERNFDFLRTNASMLLYLGDY